MDLLQMAAEVSQPKEAISAPTILGKLSEVSVSSSSSAVGKSVDFAGLFMALPTVRTINGKMIEGQCCKWS